MKIVEELILDTLTKLSERDPESSKWDFGTVLIVAGSYQARGCAALAVESALRCGVGKVILASCDPAINTCSVLVPEAVFCPCEMLREIPDKLDFSRLTSIGIGPGIGLNWELKEGLEYILAAVQPHGISTVLDADALILLKDQPFLFANKIITPHVREFSAITGLDIEEIRKNRIEVTRDYAMTNKCIVVLKGKNSLVVSPDGEVFINSTGNPGMATAGTGDVLLGVVTAFLSLMDDPFLSVCCAVYLHGLAGDLAIKNNGVVGLIARDLIKAIPSAILSVKN